MKFFFEIRLWIIATLAIFLIGCAATSNQTAVYSDSQNLAIEGYDTVYYHLNNASKKGKSEYSADWNGAVWYFTSAENRDLFMANPEKWAPAYGGYCAFGAAKNAIVESDPKFWSIVDNRLYLNLNEKVKTMWNDNLDEFIESADANWPSLEPN